MKFKKYILFIILLVLLMFLDQFSKAVAVNKLTGMGSQVIIDNFFYFTLAYNPGAAWSIMPGKITFFVTISLIVSGYMIYSLFKSKSKLYFLSTCIFLAGLLGNLIDRIKIGKVVDFLDFKIFSYDFPIFNLADTFIVIGIALITISMIKEDQNGKNKKVCC